VLCIRGLYSGACFLTHQCVAAAVPPCRRGLGSRPVTSFEYNLRREIPTNLSVRLGCDNLVSRDWVSSAATMSSQSTDGSTSNIDATFNAILRRLDAIELKMEPCSRSKIKSPSSRPPCKIRRPSNKSWTQLSTSWPRRRPPRMPRAGHARHAHRTSGTMMMDPPARIFPRRPTNSSFQNSTAPMILFHGSIAVSDTSTFAAHRSTSGSLSLPSTCWTMPNCGSIEWNLMAVD
jgi:hypothetical protein